MTISRGSLTQGEIVELDGLRGIAILLVMLHRLWPASSSFARVTEAGWIGVDLFFVISGFLITGILLETRDDPDYFRNFYARRVLRIFPLFYLLVGGMLLVFPVVQHVRGGSSPFLDRAGSPLWYLLQLGNIPEGVLGRDPPYWLAPVWSLAIEEQFYLTFPWVVRWVRPRRLVALLLAMIALAPLVRLTAMLAWPALDRFPYQFTLSRVDAIASGCLLAIVARSPGLEHRRGLRGALVAVVVGAAVVAVATGLDRTTPFGIVAGYTVVALGFAALVLLTLFARGARATAPLRLRGLRYLGKTCFGLYLLHRPADTIVSALAARAGVDGAAIWLVLVKIAVAVGLASLSWFLFERPILRLKRRFASSRHPVVDPSVGRDGAAASPVHLVAVGLIAIITAVGCKSGQARIGPPPQDNAAADGRPINDATSVGDAVAGPDGAGDARAPIDASPPDAAPDASMGNTGSVVLYPETRTQSPITAAVATHLAAIAANGTGLSGNVFAKAGDSITASSDFVHCFDGGVVALGAHANLADTIDYFLHGSAAGTSPYARESVAATGGWTAADALAGSPTPIDRERTAIQPRYAVILFGTNDNRYGRSIDAFGADLWTIVDSFADRGVIPILSTIPPLNGDPSDDARVPIFNGVVRAIAQGRGVPLVDLHRELLPLPNRGIGTDGIHPTTAATGACDLTATGLQSGYNVRNLITIEALDRARAALAGQASDATAATRSGSGHHIDPVQATLALSDLGDTRDGDSLFDTYSGCGVTGQKGHELVYRLDLAATLTIDAYVVDRGATDVDVHILAGSLLPASCVATGDQQASATVGPGAVYVVVDTAGASADGEFLLVVQAR